MSRKTHLRSRTARLFITHDWDEWMRERINEFNSHLHNPPIYNIVVCVHLASFHPSRRLLLRTSLIASVNKKWKEIIGARQKCFKIQICNNNGAGILLTSQHVVTLKLKLISYLATEHRFFLRSICCFKFSPELFAFVKLDDGKLLNCCQASGC
jgi:hypothetical protein